MVPTLTVTPAENTSDPSLTSREYIAQFTGDAITTALAPFDTQVIFLVFGAADNHYRQVQRYRVLPAQE